MNIIFKFFTSGPDAPRIADPGIIADLYRRNRMRIMLAITLGYGLSYTCRLTLGIVKKPLIDGGIFTPVELGVIGSALFYAYAFGKLTNGFLADHANMKRFFTFAVIISALCNVFMGANTAVWAAFALWGLNGWFQSFGAPAGVVSLTQWFSVRERGRYYGIWSTAHSIGEGLTFLVVSGLVSAFGWRFGFWGPGFAIIGVGICCYFVMQDRPETLGLPPVNEWRSESLEGEKTKASAAGVLQLQLSILKIPAIWVLALSSAMIYVTRYAINSWGVLYLQEIRGFSLTSAGMLLMINTIAGIVGAIAFGFISDRCFASRRPPVNFLFAVIELIGLGLFFYGPGSMPVLVAAMVMFGLGMTGLVTSIGGLFGTDICPKRVAGAAMGLVGVFSYVGAALQEYFSGLLVQGGMTMVDGVRHYDFTNAITLWIGCSVLSMILAASLWKTKLRD